MMYLEELWYKKQSNLNIEEAQKLNGKGKLICAKISEKGRECRTSFMVEGVYEVNEYQDIIIIRNKEKSYFLHGWDNNVSEIHVVEFEDSTDAKLIRRIDEAKHAVETGHKVCATDWHIRTPPIARFLSNSMFETASGSRYKMI